MTGLISGVAMAVALFFLAVLYMVFAGGSVSAEGVRNCAPREVVLERLTSKYGESLRVIAMGSNGAVVEALASGGGETWTILVTRPGGLTCLVASGTNFEVVDSPSPPKGDDA